MERELIVIDHELSFTKARARSKTLELLKTLESLGSRRFLLDFTECSSICALTALYLFALVSARQKFVSRKICTIRLPRDRTLRKEMEVIGFVDALSVAKKGNLSALWDKSNFVCGDITNSAELLKAIKRELRLNQLPLKLSSAIKETCLNVFHHAYGKPTRLIKVQWWSYFYKDTDENGEYLDIGICDRGLGIPLTIKKLYPLGNPDDSFLIKEAMRKSVTSTGRSDRGKGSLDIIKPIKFMKNSSDKLLVLSGNSGIYYKMIDGKIEDLKLPQLKNSIRGTIVQWRLYLN